MEFGRPEPAPNSVEVRDEVTEIIERSIIGAREQTRRLGGPARCLPDPDQLRRDLIAARDWAYTS